MKNYLEQSREFFSKDLYATKSSGVVIDEVRPGYARCSMKITDNHHNAGGFVMGGAIFTLADFTFAVASNCDNPLTVSLSSTINFISPAQTPLLTAEASAVKDGRNICFYRVEVKDVSGKLIACVEACGYR
ncbi:MAG: PaaI family thioesterase [Spirochaetales bacterium]|nr:PaaI family thioesterase [Spirochaetales bacterium]